MYVHTVCPMCTLYACTVCVSCGTLNDVGGTEPRGEVQAECGLSRHCPLHGHVTRPPQDCHRTGDLGRTDRERRQCAIPAGPTSEHVSSDLQCIVAWGPTGQ